MPAHLTALLCVSLAVLCMALPWRISAPLCHSMSLCRSSLPMLYLSRLRRGPSLYCLAYARLIHAPAILGIALPRPADLCHSHSLRLPCLTLRTKSSPLLRAASPLLVSAGPCRCVSYLRDALPGFAAPNKALASPCNAIAALHNPTLCPCNPVQSIAMAARYSLRYAAANPRSCL